MNNNITYYSNCLLFEGPLLLPPHPHKFHIVQITKFKLPFKIHFPNSEKKKSFKYFIETDSSVKQVKLSIYLKPQKKNHCIIEIIISAALHTQGQITFKIVLHEFISHQQHKNLSVIGA